MSIKHSLLALLSEGPRYGYQLRVEFEKRTGGTWPLNIGQVYTTLDRLERDGLVIDDGDDGEGHRFYRLAEPGAVEVASWFAQPVVAANPPRNELAIKLAIAVTTPGVDVDAVIQAQRMASTTTMQQYTRARRAADADNAPADLAWRLVLESLIYTVEAELRWLDHCEARLLREVAALRARTKVSEPATAPAPRATAGRETRA